MIYLAAPYTADDLTTRNWRYQRAREALFSLWDQHYPAVCPIILGHEYEQRQRSGPHELPHELWMTMARVQLVACTYVYVLTLKGWDTSKGVRDEVLLAAQMNKSVMGYSPFSFCDDVSGQDILKTFDVPRKRQPKPLVMLLRDNREEDE